MFFLVFENKRRCSLIGLFGKVTVLCEGRFEIRLNWVLREIEILSYDYVEKSERDRICKELFELILLS